MKHVKLKTLDLKNHPHLTEAWVQNAISEDPTILGLGEVEVRDKERRQPRAGRLDLLLQDEDGNGRYEVEIQLGATDEAHIIRTLEYWDIERRRYPQYEHTAIIIAEDITSRFLNVISLFNGFIPFMALQMKAIETPEGVALHFTRVLDTVKLGYLDEDEEIALPTDRAYWENKKGTPETVRLADRILELCRPIAGNIHLNYNKHYIGFTINGRSNNFATCKPLKAVMNIGIDLPQSSELDEKLEASGLSVLAYNRSWGRYQIKLQSGDIEKHKEILIDLLREAYERRNG